MNIRECNNCHKPFATERQGSFCSPRCRERFKYDEASKKIDLLEACLDMLEEVRKANPKLYEEIEKKVHPQVKAKFKYNRGEIHDKNSVYCTHILHIVEQSRSKMTWRCENCAYVTWAYSILHKAK